MLFGRGRFFGPVQDPAQWQPNDNGVLRAGRHSRCAQSAHRADGSYVGHGAPSKVGFIPHEDMRRLTHQHPHIADAFWRETLIDAAIAANGSSISEAARPTAASLISSVKSSSS